MLKIYAAALVAVLVLFAPQASAVQGAFHPDLLAAQTRLRKSHGPEVYLALREIWSTWNRTNPTHVEEALLAAERSPRLTPPQKAYAGLLAAFARVRRGDLKAAQARIRDLGYVDRFAIVGPFDNEGKSGFDQAFGPELEFSQPIVLGKAYSGKDHPVRWRELPMRLPYGWLDVSAFLRPEQNICTYVSTFVAAKPGSRTPRTVTAWVGTTGAYKLFWNGVEVLKDAAYRLHDADRKAVSVTLLPGQNNLSLKLCGEETAPVVSVRLGDARGAPDTNLILSASIADSVQAAETVKAVQGKSVLAQGRGPEGPLQAFERLTRGKAPRPSDLLAYAEYLVDTHGDDPTIHQARNLAQRAAEAQPTMKSLLLSSRLAEDRNHAREWLEKAAILDHVSDAEKIELQLAQAFHQRSGPNWRAAFPYFDRVLRLDPDNISAIQGRVELYNEAGLQRTALKTLERAVERNPNSVNLLNMYASQLRAVGRSVEASEVEARYSAFRFDDRSYIHSMVELSVARRNQRAAERWVDRLLQADPDSLWVLGVAARTYRAFGQTDRALATYKQALKLAPEDVGALRALADLHGERGQNDQQLALLRQILKLRPQDREVRQYVEHIEPSKSKPDEAYAWSPEKFLKLRHAKANGQHRRTLRDLTVTTVFPNGLSSKFRQVVFQPLTDAAAAAARQYAFQYQADRESVQLRGARVYRTDGSVDEAIEYGEAAANDPSIAMYTSARNFYVQFPRLEPGDVVELRYRTDETTPRNAYADYFGEIVYLQSTEPVQNAEYVLISPKSRKLYIDVKLPGLKRDVRETQHDRIYRFFKANVAPVSPEPEMPPWPEVLGFVHVSTYKDWKELGRWYWGLVKDQFDLDAETRKLAREIAASKTTDLEKIKAVYGWVINNTRYVALEFGIHGYKPRRCVQTVARGWGDCKDKATVIVTLLKELGIDATIVILRTQMRGDFKSKIPSLAPFDHAIVYVPSLDLYLDGTAEHTGSGELPRMDLEALGLLVNEGDSKLVRLPSADPAKNVVQQNLTATLAENGSAKLEIAYTAEGSGAAEWRRRYLAEGTRRDRVNADLGREFPGFTIAPGTAGLKTNDLSDVEQPAKLWISGKTSNFGRREGDELSIAVTPSARLTPKFASLSKRTQDVRILSFPTLVESFEIKLPQGAKVVSLPPESSGKTEFGSYSVSVEQKPNTVVVNTRLELHVTRVTPQKYAAFKRFCAEADRALGHRLQVSL